MFASPRSASAFFGWMASAALIEKVRTVSTDGTGHESLGGDWDLEFVAGTMETQVAVDSGAGQTQALSFSQGSDRQHHGCAAFG